MRGLELLALITLVSGCHKELQECTRADTGAYPGIVVDFLSTASLNEVNSQGRHAEGAPDCALPNTPDLSLGSGYVVFDIGCQYRVQDGPEFRVWEADDSYCDGFASKDAYRVEVSSDGEEFVSVGAAEGVGHFNSDSPFRYVKVISLEDQDGGSTPGPDIDALEML